MKLLPIPIILMLLSVCFVGCEHGVEKQAEAHVDDHHAAEHEGHEGHEHRHKIVVTSPVVKDVVTTQQYVCQIHSRRHIEVRALEGGYLEKIQVQEGQLVKEGDLMFKILPVIFQAKMNADIAEARLAEIEYTNTKQLFDQNVVSQPEVALAKARLEKAQAKVHLAKAELDFTDVKAPFDGIVDRQMNQQGSLIDEGDILTTLSDNSVMWVYFNVREADYLEYISDLDQHQASHAQVDDDDDRDDDDADDDDDDRDEDGDDERDAAAHQLRIELMLANGQIFDQRGTIGAIEADFDNTTGNIPFRADFPNPDRLLRNGQTGTILIHRDLPDAIVIPQRAVYEILARQYVFVVGEDNVVRQREITIQQELEDIFIIADGLKPDEKIIFEGIRQVRDGDTVEYEFRDSADILAHLKNHAE